jgi:hypothetical protein
MATAVEERTGVAAGLAIVLAIGGVVLAVTGSPGWGVLAHVAAGLLGVIGLLMAASPRVSGGILSITAILISFFGLGLDVFILLGMLVL